MNKIKCNRCFNKLKVIKYDCGIFIEPCENCFPEFNKDVVYEKGYEDGYENGYNERTE